MPETVTGSLEEIADKADCEPNVQTDAAELRQANCRSGAGRFILTTFATDRGQREWINEANDYGGTYLVGRKWVVSGEEKVVVSLRGRLGGTVERAGHHSGSSGTGGSGHSDGHDDGHSEEPEEGAGHQH
ncbi:hypothetical protein SAMN05421806_104166 [Streptomyces indicus]|uniref:Lipoprotein n=1 Tax=Streptomyces indicus TaxID=417292 RepID=A0A1G8YQ82_9ACTN|nr:hypothetical protein SAMN05421806_104166 [Streptomyces indicus]